MNNTSITVDNKKIMITVETTINRPVDLVWKCFTEPDHIMKWNFASDDWHCPSAVNSLEASSKADYEDIADEIYHLREQMQKA